MTTHGYSGTPLVRKLGLRAGMSVRLTAAPADYWELVGSDADGLGLRELPQESGDAADFQHIFAETRADLLAALSGARERMTPSGMIWISWPKRSSGRTRDLGRREVMATGKAHGLVDVKVCAVDETWSGLKFVIPVERREPE